MGLVLKLAADLLDRDQPGLLEGALEVGGYSHVVGTGVRSYVSLSVCVRVTGPTDGLTGMGCTYTQTLDRAPVRRIVTRQHRRELHVVKG